MPVHGESRPVRTWIEYVERYLPDDARRLERLEIDPAGMGEQTGRRAIERALARLTSPAAADTSRSPDTAHHDEAED
jgi:hypothetical protein